VTWAGIQDIDDDHTFWQRDTCNGFYHALWIRNIKVIVPKLVETWLNG